MPTRPRCARFALAYTCAATLLLTLCLEGRAQAATPPSTATRSASFESTLNEGSDFGWRVDYPFSVTRTSAVGGADGDYAARIVTNGGNSGCSCPRMTFHDGISYGAGDEVWIGGSWYVTDPSKLAWSRLMNLGHFEGSGDPDNWYLALFARGAGEMEVVARRYDTDVGRSVLMTPRAIPQGRWFDVDVHLRLSPFSGEALTEVYLDGQLVTSTTKRNMLSPGRLHFYNAGLPYFWNGNGNTTVYFDAPRLTYVDPVPPSTATRSASFESTLNEGSDFGWRIDYPFSVTRTSAVGGADGDYAVRILTNGGNSGCSCPRMTFQDGFSYGPGDEVWIGGSWYVTDPSKLAWSRLMNLGHFEGSGDPDGWYLGLLVRGTGMSVQARSYSGGSTSVLMPARPIPSTRWFDVDLHFVFSPIDGRALTQWYTDGQLVGSTTKANMVNNTRLHFYHAGLPYFWPGNGNTTVYFDAPRLTDSTADAGG